MLEQFVEQFFVNGSEKYKYGHLDTHNLEIESAKKLSEQVYVQS